MKNINYHKIVDITMMILFPRVWISKATTTHPATPVETQKKTFPLPLIRAIALLVSFLFSYPTASPAFGQEPVGVKETRPLQIGHKVPEDFWTTEHLFYINGDTVRKTLEEHKGKMLVLDFWMIGCSKCFLHQKEISHFKSKYKDDLAVVMVNGIRTKNDYSRIHQFLTNDWIKGLGLTHFSSIIESKYLEDLFVPPGYPSYYWINRLGYVQTITFRNLLDREYKAPFLEI